MIDGFFSILVMPIFLSGVIIIFIFNLFCKIFALYEYEISSDNFLHFVDYYKYPLAFLEVAFFLLLMYDGK